MDEVLAHLITSLEAQLAEWFGPAVSSAVLGPVSRADVMICLLCLLVVVILQSVAAVYIHHRVKAPPAPGGDKDLHRHALAALRKPLYILIWIYGIYFAATPLFYKVQPGEGLRAVHRLVDLVLNLGVFVVFFWFLFRATRVLEARLAARAARTTSRVDDLLVPLAGSLLRVVVIVVGLILSLPLLSLPPQYAGALGKLSSILLIVTVAGLLFRTVSIFQRVVLTRFDLTVADNLRARKVYTQLHVISRVIYVVISLFAVSAILMLFQEVRHVGTSLLASAGIAGIIVGFAAQKTLANLFAGFQIALSQPVRQDDVVVVEGEWGRVEEITLSYVVVHIWDDRRLVLPLTYFIEKPFQNWTRTSSAVTGTVLIWVDYTFPVEEGRKALKSIVEGSPLWDGRFWNLQVSDSSDRSMQLRVLATSTDSSRSWDLRCEIREKLIAFIQLTHPQSLPRLRAQMGSEPGATNFLPTL
jgi:small-conductance mechanosensitive channel